MHAAQLKNRGEQIDVFLSHDWPLGIEQHGDTAALVREKPFFRDEVRARQNPSTFYALDSRIAPKRASC